MAHAGFGGGIGGAVEWSTGHRTLEVRKGSKHEGKITSGCSGSSRSYTNVLVIVIHTWRKVVDHESRGGISLISPEDFHRADHPCPPRPKVIPE